MKKILVALVVALLFADISLAQNPDVKFIADTLIVRPTEYTKRIPMWRRLHSTFPLRKKN